MSLRVLVTVSKSSPYQVRNALLEEGSWILRDLETLVDSYLAHCFQTQSPPRVDELAKWAGVSRITLTQRFKREFGELPSEHMNDAG
jgi:AraC-like DNA-binding protein